MLNISIEKKIKERIYLMRLEGRLDSSSSVDFQKLLQNLIADGKIFFIFEAEGLHFISSSGIGAVLQTARNLAEVGGTMAFHGLNREIKNLLSFFGLNRLVAVHATSLEAEEYVSARMEETNGSEAFEVMKNRSDLNEPLESPLASSQTEEIPETQAIPEAEDEVRESPMPEASGKKIADETPSNHTSFAEPKITDCEQCGVQLRIAGTGLHQCPSCAIRFRVRRDGSMMFLEKLRSA